MLAIRIGGLILIAASSVLGADLFRDDFSHFPPGWLSSPVGSLNGAIQEYHYLTHRGVHIRAFIDGKKVLEANDSELLKGKVACVTDGPARFQDFHVWTTDAKAKEIAANIAKRDAEIARLRNSETKPIVWKKFNTPVF